MQRSVFNFLWILLLPSILAAQTDDVMLRAMKDELQRNMTELQDKDLDKPFFISYHILDQQRFTVSASLGAIANSDEGRQRYNNVRLLVGDYEFNDESLDNTSYDGREDTEIALPLDDDYYGIRRALWSTTDHVYKSAARQYKQNLETRKEKEAEGEFHFRKFAKAPAVNMVEEVKPLQYDKKIVEDLLRDVSAVFLEYPNMDGSAVFFECERNTRFIVNSEGTIARVSRNEFRIQLLGGTSRESGEEVYDQVSFIGASFSHLPNKEALKEAVHSFCKKINQIPTVEFEEEYAGPVLFMDVAVADLFASTLFGYRDRLLASDAIPDPKSNRKDTGLETKIDKSIMSELITVKAKTPMTMFNGQEVMGAYRIDNEGVQPPEEFVLVEKGVLKGLLNDRSIVNPAHTSNGHDDGPAVVEVTFSDALPAPRLKQKLIDLAREADLEYGVMVKTKIRGQGMSRIVYRVYVKDGREEEVPNASVEALSLKDLKKGISASNELVLHNVSGGSNGIVSYVVPAAVLMTNVEVKKNEVGGYKQEKYIPSPLLK